MDLSAELEGLRMAGANACAFGRTEFENPLYKSDQMPAATGESTEAWQSKAEAWRLGFTIEAAIRGR